MKGINLKWLLLACSISTLTACGSSSSSDTSNNSDDTEDVVAGNLPTAVISSQSLSMVEQRVRLDAIGSYGIDADIISYTWSITEQPDDSTAALSDINAVSPYFTPDVSGDYTLQLLTNDGINDSEEATFTLSVSALDSDNAPTVTLAEQPSMALDSSLTLDVDIYDIDGDIVSYAWVVDSAPTGAGYSLDDSTIMAPTFTADTAGDYVLTVTASDGTLETSESVTLSYSAENVAPVAVAGDPTTFELGGVASLDGSASSDSDGDTLTYTWSFISKPVDSSVSLDDASIAAPSFTPDMVGDYVLALSVSDGNESGTDYVRISATEVGSSEVIAASSYIEGFSMGSPEMIYLDVDFNEDLTDGVTKQILLATFTLEAIGKDYNFNNIEGMDTDDLDRATLVGLGLENNLRAGDKVTFYLWANLTYGIAAQLSYFVMFDDYSFASVAYEYN